MLRKSKRIAEQKSGEEPPRKVKKVKKGKLNPNKSEEKRSQKDVVQKPFKKNFNNKLSGKPFNKNDSEPPNWKEFKEKKKEVQIKRKESKNLYDVVVKVKKIGENLRKKRLQGGDEERKRMTKEIHEILKGNNNYPKLVMTHDMARIIQYLLKYAEESIKYEIVDELKSVVVEMLQSKYAKYCVQNMLKNTKASTQSKIIKACYGNAVKLASHVVSAPIFNDAFATYATPLQKQHLVQEFFGDMYKQSKDDSVNHLRDVYAKSPDMKTASLGATKANLQRVLNKQLLDSQLIQTVLMQFLQECNNEDKSEMISNLAQHVTVLSNSKEGVRAVMNCIWHGTNKDRKVIIKTLKEHVISLSKHEHGYCSIITLIDSTDDTLLINKAILTEIVKNATDLATNEWGRKVLLWLVAPSNTSYFHPLFINELKTGRENSGSKKDAKTRYMEILNYVLKPLLNQISKDPKKWFSTNSIAIASAAILKAGNGEELEKAFEALATMITDKNWKIDKTIGIENAGIHMILKKIILNDKSPEEKPKFGPVLVKHLNDDVVQKWIEYNRGCFLLLITFESNSNSVRDEIRCMLRPYKNILRTYDFPGSKILLQRLE